MSLAPETRLGPYAIEALLGAGGMGEVYRARDTRLGRLVAIKVLPHEVAWAADRQDRFDREARTIAALSHPHICTLFDVGREGEVRFLVMEYLEGNTLADRLISGPLSQADAIRLGAQIADALAAAHGRGIIHRDLKPANIAVTSTGAKVLDFGLAKFLENETPLGAVAESPTVIATGAHVILGTAAYMSPEQARGRRLDTRTDAWSLGAVLYEMLTGRQMIRGDTVADVISGVLSAPIGWEALAETTPPPVRSLLQGLLDRDPNHRLGDLRHARDVLWSLATGASDRPASSESILPAEDDKSVVVLPFANRSPDPENEYFSDGLTEEVIADLSRVKDLRVISRTSAMRLKGAEKDLRTVASELKVRYALEGSVRKSGDNLRITAQLIDTRTDAPVWSGKYGGTIADVFAIQEQVSRAIVESLRVTLSEEEEKQLAAPVARNPKAYPIYLLARRDIMSFQKSRIDRAKDELEQAMEELGEDPLLLRGLGTAYWQYVNGGVGKDEGHLDKAESYARRILELDPGDSGGYQLLSYIATQRGDIAEWIRQGRRALDLDPTDPDVLMWLGVGWAWAGFPARARPILERLLSVDPLFDYGLWGLSWIDYMEGRYDEGLDRLKRAQRLSPDHPGWAFCIGQLVAAKGDAAEAVRAIDGLVQPVESHPLARLTHVFRAALAGDARAAAALTADEMIESIWGDLQYTHVMAQAQAMLGRVDEGLKWLTRSFERGTINYPLLSRGDPLLANLRETPGFDALMVRVQARWEGFETEVGADPALPGASFPD